MNLKLSTLPYFQRWFIVGAIIGVVAGFGALAFYFAIRLFELIFFTHIVGMPIPHPLGEGGSLVYHFYALRYYLIPVVVAAGGLITGFIIYTFDPSSEGHGTDAAIRSFHYNHGKIKRRTPVVKTIASAITIGSGGSAGREGPTALIAAGIGSFLADILGLSPKDRRIAVAVGIGAGIGTIFKAPIGGAVLGAEILYRRDFESEVIFPSLVASSIGYSIFASVVGFAPIFGDYLNTFNVLRLPFYAVLGLVAGLFSILYIRTFYGVRNLFKKFKIPNHFKPMIGGAIVGVIALLFPEILGTGYGWVELLEYGKFNELVTFGLPILLILVLLPFVKIIATSFTVSSGGSGGVFAPGIFIGASLGALFGVLFHMVSPGIVPAVAPFVIIGMLSFFGAAGKAPLAVILMVVEMTGSLQLLPGAMLAVSIAYIASGTKYSIYESQVEQRRDSPANMGEYHTPMLLEMKVSSLNIINDVYADLYYTIYRADNIMKENELLSLPVVYHEKLMGAVYLYDIVNRSYGYVKDYYKAGISYVKLENSAENAWELMMKNRTKWCAVVDNGKFMGIITLDSILNKYEDDIKLINQEDSD
ncbi:chloride channel protein [Ferroplasma acidiphilum]|uniref:CBS domain-containing protein n=1 Tax=Ferroplasma acidiphilum TaxID=74969 RepID=A0A1V0N4P5_9ARCH|nr:chloride channel protein [Ferroplasma acidiphilum]ARD85081.1 chloride channel protein [Ferroplasma acidiphilum]NOL60434.1 CBS domain-containing protein [Ferroplasma acidiphilum]WMT54021.1 MAG: chloride channel protein [Ferroplasma acidiphilum]